jgi:hypothetical protein
MNIIRTLTDTSSYTTSPEKHLIFYRYIYDDASYSSFPQRKVSILRQFFMKLRPISRSSSDFEEYTDVMTATKVTSGVHIVSIQLKTTASCKG